LEVFRVLMDLVPAIEGFDIDGADIGVAVIFEELDEVTADETPGSADCNFGASIHLW
jgi:hypothetical protein